MIVNDWRTSQKSGLIMFSARTIVRERAAGARKFWVWGVRECKNARRRRAKILGFGGARSTRISTFLHLPNNTDTHPGVPRSIPQTRDLRDFWWKSRDLRENIRYARRRRKILRINVLKCLENTSFREYNKTLVQLF